MCYSVPILVIAFNRPDTTKAVLDNLRNIKPRHLYFAVDGPRSSIKNENLLVTQVQRLVESIDWECEVKTKFQSENLGCGAGVRSAIDWFFNEVDFGIINEDDVILDYAFFDFVARLKDRYLDQDRVKAILAFNVLGQELKSDEYFFYEGFYPWGWACWSRTWRDYNNLLDYEGTLAELNHDKQYVYLNKAIDFHISLISNGLLDTWDYQFLKMMRLTGGVVIAPYANLSQNIGVNGAHSIGNELDFRLGKMGEVKLHKTEDIVIDQKMNRQLLQEYSDAKLTIFIKSILLKFGLYKTVKKLYRMSRRLN